MFWRCMSIPLKLPVLASSSCMLSFCLWDCLGAHFSFMQKFCLSSSTLGQIAPKVGRGDAWILTSFLGLLFPLGFYSMGLYPLDRPRSAVPTYRVVNLLFTLLPPFRTSNSTISLSLLPLTLTFPVSPSLLASRRAPLLCSSVIWMKKLTYSKDLQDCLCPAVLTLLCMLGWLKLPMRTFTAQTEAKAVKRCMVRCKNIFTAAEIHMLTYF